MYLSNLANNPFVTVRSACFSKLPAGNSSFGESKQAKQAESNELRESLPHHIKII